MTDLIKLVASPWPSGTLPAPPPGVLGATACLYPPLHNPGPTSRCNASVGATSSCAAEFFHRAAPADRLEPDAHQATHFSFSHGNSDYFNSTVVKVQQGQMCDAATTSTLTSHVDESIVNGRDGHLQRSETRQVWWMVGLSLHLTRTHTLCICNLVQWNVTFKRQSYFIK